MSGGRGSKWGTFKSVLTVVNSSQVRDEGQPRGWERQRDDVRPPANNPPPSPTRPSYPHLHHYTSDPGPPIGNGPWHNSSPPPPQGSPPSLYSQNTQGQYQAGFNPQGYGPPPPSDGYQFTHSQTYGQNQGHFGPPPPASHPQYNPSYQQQPVSSAVPNYQAGQGAYPFSYNQPTFPPASNSYRPPLPARPYTQGTQGPGQNTNFAGPPVTRTVTAPANLHCGHEEPGDPL